MTDERDYMPEFGEEEMDIDPDMDFEEEIAEEPPVRVAPRDRKPAPPKKKKAASAPQPRKKGHFFRLC